MMYKKMTNNGEYHRYRTPVEREGNISDSEEYGDNLQHRKENQKHRNHSRYVKESKKRSSQDTDGKYFESNSNSGAKYRDNSQQKNGFVAKKSSSNNCKNFSIKDASNFHVNEALNKKFEIEATTSMAAWCFDVLLSEIRKHSWTPEPPEDIGRLGNIGITCPLFVTWMKKVSGHHHLPFNEAWNELRGCIGCMEPIPILDLASFAIKSGLEDHRFKPISEKEVPLLTCKVSFLKNFEPCEHVYAWKIGSHGIIINFEDKKGKMFSATFLPEIALEHKMSHQTAIRELIKKSQFKGAINDELINRISVTRYASTVATLDYDEYIRKYK